MLDLQAVVERSLSGTRSLDAAKGVVVVLRRCSLAEAFSEILEVARQYQVGVLAVSQALVEMAEGGNTPHATAAQEAAHRTWAALLEQT